MTAESMHCRRCGKDTPPLNKAPFRNELGDRVHSIQFEDFLADPIAKIKELCSFLSVPFVPANGDAVLEFIDPELVRYGKNV